VDIRGVDLVASGNTACAWGNPASGARTNKTHHQGNKMKLLSLFAVVSLFTAAAAFGADKKYTEGSCCDKAKKAGKECTHPCCVKAEKEGKVCAKCNK
jgi:hypothetical protein